MSHRQASRSLPALIAAPGMIWVVPASVAHADWQDGYTTGWRDGYQAGYRDGSRQRHYWHRPYYGSSYQYGYHCRSVGSYCPPGTVPVPNSPYASSSYRGYSAYSYGNSTYGDPAYGAAPYAPPAPPSGLPTYYQDPSAYPSSGY